MEVSSRNCSRRTRFKKLSRSTTLRNVTSRANAFRFTRRRGALVAGATASVYLASRRARTRACTARASRSDQGRSSLPARPVASSFTRGPRPRGGGTETRSRFRFRNFRKNLFLVKRHPTLSRRPQSSDPQSSGSGARPAPPFRSQAETRISPRRYGRYGHGSSLHGSRRCFLSSLLNVGRRKKPRASLRETPPHRNTARERARLSPGRGSRRGHAAPSRGQASPRSGPARDRGRARTRRSGGSGLPSRKTRKTRLGEVTRTRRRRRRMPPRTPHSVVAARPSGQA